MPFFDDSGIRLEEHQGALWRSFALFADQIERMIAASMGWSLQLLPAAGALAFPELPLAVRLLCIVYTSVAVIPATGILYGLALAAAEGEMVGMGLLREVWADLAWASLRSLLPLYSLLVLLWSAVALLPLPFLLDVLGQLALLLGALLANYWGPLLAEDPARSASELLTASAGLVWAYPGRTLLLCAVVFLLGLLATVSVAGLFLAAPVLIALLQAQQLQANRGG